MLSEQPILLEKPAIWSHLFLWLIMLGVTSGIAWAYFAKIEQSIPAVGKLELEDGAIKIQAPTTGTVVRLHVENGDRVVKDQPLMTFSPTAPNADLKSLNQIKAALEKENQFYRDVIAGNNSPIARADLESLLKEREERILENQTMQALIDELYLGRGITTAISPNQQGLYANSRAEYESRIGAVNLQIGELQKQLQQAQEAEAAARQQLRVSESQIQYSRQQLLFAQQQLANTEQQLINSREQLDSSRLQLEHSKEILKNTQAQVELDKGQLAKSEQVLRSNEEILERFKPLAEEGALPDLQKKQQEQQVLRGEAEVLNQREKVQSRASEISSRMGELQSRMGEIKMREGDLNARQGEVNARRGDINTRQAEINTRIGEIQARQAEVDKQILEQQRISVSIERAKEQIQNTKDAWARELYVRMADNKKGIAGAESQLSRLQLENSKRLSEINGQLEKAKQSRDTQVIKAPVPGIIYELKPTKKGKSGELDMKKDPTCQYVINSVLKPGDPRPQRCNEAYYESQQTEEILQVLSGDTLQAVVYLQNKDLALVLNAFRRKEGKLSKYHNQEITAGGKTEKIDCEVGKSCVCPKEPPIREKLGLKDLDCVPVEVSVEAFPAMEYGTAPGEVKSISKDAEEPTQTRQFYAFKTKIELKGNEFLVDKETNLKVKMQNGMAVSSNINIGKRSVLDMFIGSMNAKFNKFKTLD